MARAVDIYKFLSFREFLRHHYAHHKAANRNYSHRYIALKLGLKSSGFFAEVLNGKRNLSTKNIVQFAEFCKLDPEESQYFELLVRFEQADTLSEKNFWLKKIMLCKHIEVTLLNKDVHGYFSQWYHVAIRELLFFRRFSGNYEDLAASLMPPITPAEARESIELMERLGLIAKDEKGVYRQKDTILSTGDTVRSLEVARFQSRMMEHALAALDKIPPEDREVSTLTLSLSKDGFAEVKSLLAKSRKQILKIAKMDFNEERVFQLNLQFFPLTLKKPAGKTTTLGSK